MKVNKKFFCILIAIILLWIIGENTSVKATTEKVLFDN